MSSKRTKAKSIGHYILGKTIGEGTFGKVKLGTHILTGEKVAVKILEKERIVDVADVERVAREIHILKLIRHPNIIQLYEIIETPKQLYLIMEYASGGELFDYIVAHSRVKEKEATKFFQQIVAGVEYVHTMNVAHRDLKPENLLLDENRNIKIVDFGLSNTFNPNELLKTACGSPCYAAPEMIAGKRYHGPTADIWSCGVIMFALICGYLPFEDQNTAALYKKILNGEYTTPRFISTESKDLIRGMLTTDPAKRFCINDIRKHPWFNQTKVYQATLSAVFGQNGPIQLDQDVIRQLEQFGFNREYAIKCLEMNKHNHVTTTYYLLLDKKHRLLGKMNNDSAESLFAATSAMANMSITPRPPKEKPVAVRPPRGITPVPKLALDALTVSNPHNGAGYSTAIPTVPTSVQQQLPTVRNGIGLPAGFATPRTPYAMGAKLAFNAPPSRGVPGGPHTPSAVMQGSQTARGDRTNRQSNGTIRSFMNGSPYPPAPAVRSSSRASSNNSNSIMVVNSALSNGNGNGIGNGPMFNAPNPPAGPPPSANPNVPRPPTSQGRATPRPGRYWKRSSSRAEEKREVPTNKW